MPVMSILYKGKPIILMAHIFQQPSEDKKVTFDEKVPGKTVVIVFTPTPEGVVTVDSVEVDFCYEEGMITFSRRLCNLIWSR